MAVRADRAAPVKPSTRRQRERELVKLAGSPERATAVEDVLAGRIDHAEPGDGDKIAARQWAYDALAEEQVDWPAFRIEFLAAIERCDVHGAIAVAQRRLPPRMRAAVAEALFQVGRDRRST